MAEIKIRETWRNGDEVSYDVEAHVNGRKMFAPGASVTRERYYGNAGLVTSVRWASSSSESTLDNAKAQLAVMTAALELAQRLEDGLDA